MYFVSSFTYGSFCICALLGMWSFSELFLFRLFLALLGVDIFVGFQFVRNYAGAFLPLSLVNGYFNLPTPPFFVSIFWFFQICFLFRDHGTVGDDGLLRMINFG